VSFFPRSEASPHRHIRRNATAAAILFLLVFSIAKPGFAQEPQSPGQSQNEEQPKSIRGTVINSVTKSPASRALVYSADNRYATLTDIEGRFEFILPKEENETRSNNVSVIYSSNGSASYSSFGPMRPGRGGQMWLRARKPGFLEDEGWGGGVMTAASPGVDATIAIEPEALIKGRVTLSTGDVASNINVQLFSRTVVEGFPRWMPGATVRANSAGEFRFAELRPGSYKLVTNEWMDNDPVAATPGGQLYGFPPVYYPASADFSTAASIELTAGEIVEADLSLTRQAYYPVRIPVASEDIGNGMRVSVQGQRGPGYELGFNMGAHRIEGMLPNGTYAVTASTFGEIEASGKITLVVAGGPAETASLVPTRNSSIHINVKEEFNEKKSNTTMSFSSGRNTYTLNGPRAYLNISVENADEIDPRGNARLRPPTGPNDDAFVLENVAPGRYWLRAQTGEGYVASASMGTSDLLREPMAVGAGTNPSIEMVVRDDGAEIEGTITDIANRALLTNPNDNGNPFPQAWIYCVPLSDSTGQFQQIGVSQEGKFQHSMLAPGSYRILAFTTQQPFLPYRDPEAMKVYESKGQVVNLTAGQKTTVEVQTIPVND
jgi:hypothetical protein